MPSIPSGQRRQPFFIALSAKAMAYLRISSKMPLTCLKLFHLSDPASTFVLRHAIFRHLDV